ATPASGWCYAHLLATDAPHEYAKAYRFDRFEKGLMIDEKGVGNNPQLH
ncbi:MAG: sarcosine oxidase subunit beta, partial [Paracoccaceae bacterium]|nr:sarcosine oxidase subunit beta [Paracoccaceae bacterium]